LRPKSNQEPGLNVFRENPASAPPLPSSRLLLRFNARLLIALTIIFSLLLTLYALWDIRRTRQEFSGLLQNQAISLLSLAHKGLSDAAQSLDYLQSQLAERLLDNARLLEQLDRQSRLTPALLTQLAEQNHLFRVQVFDGQGRLVMTNGTGEQHGAGPGPGPRVQLQPILKGEEQELVLGFRQGRFGSGQRFAVARKRSRGGVITVNADAEEMLHFRRTMGAGSFMRTMKEIPDVRYMVLQDSVQVLQSSEADHAMNSIPSDPFLLAALADSQPHFRFSEYENERIAEIVQTIVMDPFDRGLLRIGLSTSHLAAAETNALRRVLLQSLLFVFVSVALTHFIISLQNYRTLQQAYRRIEGHTGSILAHLHEAVVALDANARVTVFNVSAEKLFNLRPDQVIGRPCPAHIDVCGWLTQALESGKDLVDQQGTITVEEKQLVIHGDITVLRDGQGRIDTVFAVMRDMTQQQRLADQIKRQEQLTAMGHLASGVAHEIRNPLNAVSMIAQRLGLEFSPKEDAEEYHRLTQTVVSESRRINDIIQQFLTFAKPAPLNRDRCRVEEILHHVAGLIRPTAEAKGIHVTVHAQPVREIEIDRDKMAQALLNLAQNSVDACSSGDEIQLACRPMGDKVHLIVRDNGPGIQQGDLGKIFHLYYTTREKGTGIGLSIVQQIVNQHDGLITVNSSPGQGATFTIELG